MKVLKKLSYADGSLYGYAFKCPGCKDWHQITTKWEFNGDLVSPTFSPSYLTWVDPNPKVDPIKFPKYYNGFRCHSYIRDGFIEYLSDSTHKLAGKRVRLPAARGF